MEVFTSGPAQTEEKVFTLPLSRPQFKVSETVKNKEKALYPLVSGMTREEVAAHVDAGITAPVIAATDNKNRDRQAEIVQQVVNSQPSFDVAISEIETARNDNPLLKALISPATLAAYKQSESPLARRAAQGKLANALMASELILEKVSETKEALWTDEQGRGAWRDTVLDFTETLVSGIPIVSRIQVERRKQIANEFVQLLDSNEDPALIKTRLSAILDQAADQGFFSENNQFFLGDFISLVEEGTEGNSAVSQEFFANLDAVVGIAGVASDAGRLLARVGRNSEEVKAVLSDALRVDNASTGHSNPAAYTESLGTPEAMRPSTRLPSEATALFDLNLETKAIQDAMDIRIASGQYIDDEAFATFAADIVSKKKEIATKTGQKRYIDTKVSLDDLENVYLEEFYGTTKGAAYTSEVAARKAADLMGGADVVPASNGQGFLVAKRTNLPTGMFYKGASPEAIYKELNLFRETDVEELGFGFFTKYTFSPLSQTTTNLNSILKMGESARARAQEIFSKSYEPLVKSVGKQGVKAVGNVILDIRDGSRAHLRTWPTTTEFEGAFFQINKRLPTDKEKELYAVTVSRSDTDWYLTSDMHFKREVNMGVEIYLQDGLELAGVKASKETFKDAKVWNADAKRYVNVSDLPEEAQLIRLAEPTEFDGALHDLIATSKPKTRALKHTDVLGYNPGGTRTYAPNRTNFILKQNQETPMADGRIFTGRPTAIMAAKTQQEAEKATFAINSIIEAVNDVVFPRGVKTGTAATKVKTGAFAYSKDEYLRAVNAQYKNKELNDFIASMSDWNPNVHSVETLVQFFDDMKLDLRKGVDFAEDGKPLVDGDTFVGDLTFKDVMGAPGVLKRGNVRKDQVMLGYGGSPLPTVPAMEAIQKSFTSSIARSSSAAYEAAAINGLVKSLIRGVGKGGDFKPLVTTKTLEEIRHLPLRQKIKALDGKIFTGTAAGKKLELERQKILYRLESQSYLDAGIAKMKDNLANVIYDKGWTKTADFMDAMSAEPISAMRGIVFDTYLGMFAPDQLWVQASQITNVIALSKGLNGVRAVAAMPVIRKLVMNGHAAPTAAMAERMSSMLSMTPKQFIDMVGQLKMSGRVNVAASLADLGEDSAGKVAFRRVREAGRVFYNEGELASRITAHISAAMEYVAKAGPEADLTTNAAKKYLAHQSDVFTNAMTSTSRTGIEQLPMMQFMSYSMRMGEYLLGGLYPGSKKSAITLAQKGRLFATQLALYGMSAVPFAGYYLDWFNFKNGTNLSENDYITIRHGAIDGLIEYMTGVESEVGRRLAWGEGMYNTINDLATKSVGETLLGPMGSLSQDVLEATTKMIYNTKIAGTSMLAEDFVDVMRTIKSVNLGYNSYLAFKYGEYQTKTGNRITGDLDGSEAAAIALGVPLSKVNDVWRSIEMLKKDTNYYKERAKVITGILKDMNFEYEHNGWNTKRADMLRKAYETIYAIEGLDPYDIQQINRFVDDSVLTLSEQTVLKILRTDAAKREQVME